MRRITFVAPAVILLLLISLKASAQEAIVSKTFAVEPGHYTSFSFYVPVAGASVRGRFRAQGGRGNDVEAFIVDQDGFENYANGHDVRTYYSSGRVTVGTINTSLNSGRYYLVFNNSFSTFSNKVVDAHIFLISNTPIPRDYSPPVSSRGRSLVANSLTKLLNVRSAPSPRAPVIGQVRKYEKLFVIRTLGRWTEIEWNGGSGFVLSRYVGY